MKYKNDDEKRIGEFFIKAGILKKSEVEKILKYQKRKENKEKFTEACISLGYLTKEEVEEYLKSLRN